MSILELIRIMAALNPWDITSPSSTTQAKSQKPKLQTVLASRLKANILGGKSDRSRTTKNYTLPLTGSCISALYPMLSNNVESPDLNRRNISCFSRNTEKSIPFSEPSQETKENYFVGSRICGPTGINNQGTLNVNVPGILKTPIFHKQASAMTREVIYSQIDNKLLESDKIHNFTKKSGTFLMVSADKLDESLRHSTGRSICEII